MPWDFFSFLTLILRLSMFFNPLKIFVPIALCCFALSFIKLVLDIIFAMMRADEVNLLIFARPVVSVTALLLFLTGLQVLLVGMISDGIIRKMDSRSPPSRFQSPLGSGGGEPNEPTES